MSTQTRLTDKTRRLVYMAILIAIILVMAFTPLGYLKTAGLEITFIQVPVIVGAILMGPTAGAILGGVFGLTSFIQCFGLSAFGAALLEINAVYTFILCFFSRVLMGWLTGLIFRALQKVDRTKFVSYAVTSLAAPILNTVFFVGGMILLFGLLVLYTGTDGGGGRSQPAVLRRGLCRAQRRNRGGRLFPARHRDQQGARFRIKKVG